MNPQTTETTFRQPSARSKRMLGGVMLILFGVGLLISYLGDSALWMVPLPGLLMLVYAILSRDSGWFIPAGVLNGIALGILALEGPLQIAGQEPQSGAVFLLCFALGWVSIPLFSALFTRDRHLWALIPGGVMAGTGALILLGERGLQVLELVGYLVPAALILVGALLIFKKHK